MLNRQMSLIILLPLLALAAAQAQPDRPALPTQIVEIPLEQRWPTSRLDVHQHLQIVTLAQPARRHTCNVQSIDEDEIICAAKKGASPTVYLRPDVLAIVEPRTSRWVHWGEFSALLSTSGGVYYGVACLVALSAPYLAIAIPVAVVGFVLAFDSLWFLADDQPKDWLLYQKPGETLQLQLHA